MFGERGGLQDGFDRLDLNMARQYELFGAQDWGHLHFVT